MAKRVKNWLPPEQYFYTETVSSGMYYDAAEPYKGSAVALACLFLSALVGANASHSYRRLLSFGALHA